jgi:hypothetical protein
MVCRTAVLHNLRTDTKVLEFRNASGVGMTSDASLLNGSSSNAATAGGACTAISFRTGLSFISANRHTLNGMLILVEEQLKRGPCTALAEVDVWCSCSIWCIWCRRWSATPGGGRRRRRHHSLGTRTAAAAGASCHQCSTSAFKINADVYCPGARTHFQSAKPRPALQTVLRDAHDAPLTSLHFIAGEPRLMSAAADNSVKQWLFDNADGSGRLLRFRSGHAAPPSCLRYYGDGTRLLSAGLPKGRTTVV